MIPGSIKTTAQAVMTRERSGPVDGDVRRLEEAYDRYASPMFRYARALVGSSEDAEDAVQEVFVRLARDAGRLRQIEDLNNYLLRSTRNAAYEILRCRRKRDKLTEDAASDLMCPSDESCCLEIERVLEAFRVLPVEQREVLALKVFQGMTFKEIAGVVGVSQNTVASRYRYAIERIRSAVGEE